MNDEQKKEPRFHGEVSEKSHKNMSHIKGKDTSIELALRKELWARGYRYRKNYKKLPGRVLHFWGKDIIQNPAECIKEIEEEIYNYKLERTHLDYTYKAHIRE